MIFVNECFCYTLVLFWQWLSSLLFANMNINQFTIHHNEIEDALLSSMKNMNMYWLMLVRKEIEDKSKILKYLWQNSLNFMFTNIIKVK